MEITTSFSRRVGAVLPGYQAVRALYSWTSPTSIGLTLVLMPFFQTVFFAVVGAQVAEISATHFVVGLSALASCYLTIFGGVMLVAYERRQATWAYILTARMPLYAVLARRGAVLAILGAALGSALLILSGVVITGGRAITAGAAISVFLVAFSTAGMGLATGLLVRHTDEPLIHGNLVFGLITLLTGAVAPVSSLNSQLGALSHLLPGTAAMGIARGEPNVAASTMIEIGVGLGWWITAALLAVLVARGRWGREAT